MKGLKKKENTFSGPASSSHLTSGETEAPSWAVPYLRLQASRASAELILPGPCGAGILRMETAGRVAKGRLLPVGVAERQARGGHFHSF